jgi:hypothetical protein
MTSSADAEFFRQLGIQIERERAPEPEVRKHRALFWALVLPLLLGFDWFVLKLVVRWAVSAWMAQ